MANFGLILVCVLAGIALRRSGRFDDRAPAVLGTFVIYVSLPALVLARMPALLEGLPLDASTIATVAMAWISFALAFVVVQIVGKARGWSRPVMGALVLTIGLGNTSFVGYPLVEALLGPEGLRYAVLADQPGSFLVLSTVGMVAGLFYAGRPSRESALLLVVRRVASFPPMIALVVAALWGFSGTFRPTSALVTMLDKIASTLVPVALVTVGAQLRIDRAMLRRNVRYVAFGLVLKLVVFPAFFAWLYVHVLGLRGTAVVATVLESAMSPMVTGAVLAAEVGLDAELASVMVGLGIPLSFVTVTAWYSVLKSAL